MSLGKKIKKVSGNKFSKQTDREKKAGVAILILDKIKFKKGDIKRHPEVHFKTLKGIIHQEDINIVNIYAPNIGAPKYIKKTLEDFKKDIDSNTIVVRDFNIPLSTMDRSSKQNINKDVVALNNALDQMDLIDIYRTLLPKEAKIHSLFKCTWNISKDRPHKRTHTKNASKIQEN